MQYDMNDQKSAQTKAQAVWEGIKPYIEPVCEVLCTQWSAVHNGLQGQILNLPAANDS